MSSDELVARLTGELKPVSSHVLEKRLAGAVAAGAIVAFAALASTLGLRQDLEAAFTTFPFLLKAAYTVSIAAIAVFVAAHLARPDSLPRRWFALVLGPTFVLLLIAAFQIAASPAADWRDLLFGMSASNCSVRILAISSPVFVALILAFRTLAPTRLRAAGAAAGLAAGAVGAAIYALYCRETSPSFVLTWYTLGMSLPAVIGAVVGPRLLRW